ncbi:putative multifunctional protein that exhibits several independent functions at different levels of the cellular processes [Lyophyllum shimeji]|uniref:5'-3' exoribonuclease 1 n=1 Tax=Lyophyllum shimeji TaxID=47721 RepID=A0A9P3UQZ8_LYOSH|nr:putative multifunctional protein that exhibits several independent functions at different levels of the cellular processes [Lyophyllum shimeji]
MGIPKFFRYISERYPLTSQLIQENKIPEFDNLYLDFNGIIHNCSHPNDEDAHFRLSEEQIFTSIFAYVDHLFGKIKPKKLFFMAVDGVAPRAKMNQQRSRRFRTAKEAKEIREKAESKGEKLPDEKAFDSNCITPGTPFMARLSAQLRYFINKKITEDSNWRDVEVVLSGHEVPGEGEHKIMEYIRLSRAQPDYNPNVRHCLYGLDADLIMLGLLSHDPHFCLLREEVKFGPASRKKGGTSLQSINFYLLHLSLMREYLDLEFRDIEPMLPFDYNLERIIDDFILLAVFVGNDFLPNLPDLHIHENGLEKLFDVYKKVLPAMDGYINESGSINTKRLQLVLDEMAVWEQEVFEKEYADANWYKGKQAKHLKEMELAQKRAKLVLTAPQREIFDKVKAFVMENRHAATSTHMRGARLAMPNDFPARERKFIEKLAEDLHLNVRWDEYDEQDVNLVTLRFPGVQEELTPEPPVNGAGTPIAKSEGDGDEWEDVDEEDEESRAAIDRVLKKYEKAQVVQDDEGGGFDARYERSMKEKMDEWKRAYYRGKLEISYDDPKEMGDLVYTYVEGLQWVMHYYYSGVASWSWFYSYHYAPRISDLRGVDTMEFKFELGKPFRPFEQLMGVLPVASMEHIPSAYQDLMYDPNSSILDFYPLEFEQDLNGKKQDWEAIVKIPFIDEARLLKAMAAREHRLTPEEKQRNTFGTSTKFTFSTGEPTLYPSSLPGFFPPLYRCTCRMEPFDLPTLDGLHLVPGLCDGVLTGVDALAGFPSLKTLPHTATLGFHGVNVHGSESRNKSMVVQIVNPHEHAKTEDIARKMVGERTFMGWPFLQEGLVVAVSDSLFKYEKMAVVPGTPPKVLSNPHAPQGLGHWKMKAERIEQVYSKRSGVLTGPVEILLHVRPLKGLKRLEDGAFVKDYEDPDKEVEQAVQMCLPEVVSEDPRYLERAAPPLSEEFPEGSKIFFLGEHAYGVAAQVSATEEKSLSVILAFYPSDKAENDKFKAIVQSKQSSIYYPSFRVADMISITGRALSKITSSFMVITSDNQKTNLGLSLKFEAKALKVIDYSRKDGRHWEFSEKAVGLLREYKAKFPEIFHCLDVSGDAMSRAADILPGVDADARVREIKGWLKSKGVRDFEPVSLFCDQLSKDTVAEIEKLQDTFTSTKSTGIKKAIVKGIPRQAVLKPAHAIYRLQNQHFALGDRVTMVQDSGGVPLSVKGVVIGLNAKSMDVVWDVAFMSGVTLGDRCSQYRGSTVEFNTCLNLTNPQFVTSTNPKAPPPPQNPPFKPRFGPHPVVRPAPGQAAASGFRPAPASTEHAPVHIMTNPNRGRGGYPNGRGAHLHPPATTHIEKPTPQPPTQPTQPNGAPHVIPHVGRGLSRGGRGFGPQFRGRGGFVPGLDRGRVLPRGGYRGGRGRGSFAAPLPS